MSENERHLNERPYSSGYVALEVDKTSDTPSYVTPWLAMEDIDEADKNDVMMYSLVSGEEKRFALSEFEHNVPVDEFYSYMTETCGLSENKTINLLFGNKTVSDYGEAFSNVFNTACLDYREKLEDIAAAYDAREDEFETGSRVTITAHTNKSIEEVIAADFKEGDEDELNIGGEFTEPNPIEEPASRDVNLEEVMSGPSPDKSEHYPNA